MYELLWLIPALPLAVFVLTATVPFPRRAVAVLGSGAVGVAMAVALWIAARFICTPPVSGAFTQTLWTWLPVTGLDAEIALRLDALSAVFILVITAVGFAILLYSAKFMEHDDGYRRFFAYMNLFIASMLILVLADNLALLYLGWEGVGLCSYLLIGFWYRDPANGRSARKAFLVTRVGDTAMIIGLVLLAAQLGTLQIHDLLARAEQVWPAGSAMATAAALLLLAGAVGKSAQLPLQTWLPDAMAGPTPVSALIHAATMVTAGVYLIARTNTLFTLSPFAQQAVAWIGAATLLLAAFSALTQRDIKRILAYSTMSQIGYMFLALGVGAWSAGVYHFITHALFKSALFLGAGVLIFHLDDEHDIFKMGGLRQHFRLTYRMVLLSGLTLAAVPPFTLTFNSKDMILREVLLSPRGGPMLWTLGMVGAALTAAYTFRLIFVVFYGPVNKIPTRSPSRWMLVPMAALAVGSGLAGIPELLSALFGMNTFGNLLDSILPIQITSEFSVAGNLLLQAASAVMALLGIGVVWWVYRRRPTVAGRLVSFSVARRLRQLWFVGWGFDGLYDRLFVRPYVWLANVNASDAVDWLMERPATAAMILHRGLSRTQNGMLRWYAMGVAAGAILITALVVWL